MSAWLPDMSDLHAMLPEYATVQGTDRYGTDVPGLRYRVTVPVVTFPNSDHMRAGRSLLRWLYAKLAPEIGEHRAFALCVLAHGESGGVVGLRALTGLIEHGYGVWQWNKGAVGRSKHGLDYGTGGGKRGGHAVAPEVWYGPSEPLAGALIYRQLQERAAQELAGRPLPDYADELADTLGITPLQALAQWSPQVYHAGPAYWAHMVGISRQTGAKGRRYDDAIRERLANVPGKIREAVQWGGLDNPYDGMRNDVA